MCRSGILFDILSRKGQDHWFGNETLLNVLTSVGKFKGVFEELIRSNIKLMDLTYMGPVLVT